MLLAPYGCAEFVEFVKGETVIESGRHVLPSVENLYHNRYATYHQYESLNK
jgi:hypothetical protein